MNHLAKGQANTERWLKMEVNYRYKLDKKNNKKHRCPKCQKDKVFTLYVSKKTGDVAGTEFGVCSRRQSCGYTNYPVTESDFWRNDLNTYLKRPKRIKPPKQKKYLDKGKYKDKLYRSFDNNRFCDFVQIQIGVKNADKAISKYLLGTGDHGSVIYPYFDKHFNLVTYKTMLIRS